MCAPFPTLLRSNTFNFSGPPNSGRSVTEWAPSLIEKGDGRLRPSLQQRLPGTEGPPEGCSSAPRHAACGGPLPSSAEGRALSFGHPLSFEREREKLLLFLTAQDKRVAKGSARKAPASQTRYH